MKDFAAKSNESRRCAQQQCLANFGSRRRARRRRSAVAEETQRRASNGSFSVSDDSIIVEQRQMFKMITALRN